MGAELLSLPPRIRSGLERAREDLNRRGVRTVVTSTFRSVREQTFLYNMFLRGQTSFPVAPPGRSRHQFGLAVDLIPVDPSDLPVVVDVMRAVGFRWAGTADSVHFDWILPTPTPPERPPRSLGQTKVPQAPRRPPSTGTIRPAACPPFPSCCL